MFNPLIRGFKTIIKIKGMMFNIADLENRILQNGFVTIKIVSDFDNEVVSTCDFNDVNKAIEYCEGLDYELFAFIA